MKSNSVKKNSGQSNQEAQALQDALAGQDIDEAAFSMLAFYGMVEGSEEESAVLERRVTAPSPEQAKRLAHAKKRSNKKLSSLTAFTAEQHRSLKFKRGGKRAPAHEDTKLENLFEAEITTASELEPKPRKKRALSLLDASFMPFEGTAGLKNYIFSSIIVFLLISGLLLLTYPSWKAFVFMPKPTQDFTFDTLPSSLAKEIPSPTPTSLFSPVPSTTRQSSTTSKPSLSTETSSETTVPTTRALAVVTTNTEAAAPTTTLAPETSTTTSEATSPSTSEVETTASTTTPTTAEITEPTSPTTVESEPTTATAESSSTSEDASATTPSSVPTSSETASTSSTHTSEATTSGVKTE